ANDDDATANDDDATANDDDATANDDDATANDDDATANDDDATGDDDDATSAGPCCYTLQMWDGSGAAGSAPGWQGGSLSIDAGGPNDSGPYFVSPTASPGPGWWAVDTFCVPEGTTFDVVFTSGSADADLSWQLFSSSGSFAVELAAANTRDPAAAPSIPPWYPAGGANPAGVVATIPAMCTTPDPDPSGFGDYDGDGFRPADGDCDDTDPHVFPGQTMWFWSDLGPTATGSWDYNCDSAATQLFNTVASCTSSGAVTAGWGGNVAACGAFTNWADTCVYVGMNQYAPDASAMAMQRCR
ncbi:MAG: hypothetical protein KDA24_17880, partial [Deltaproteobacteria bacterium]|nr:hypothetical protein [Deltaproteobacteria bacterium]